MHRPSLLKRWLTDVRFQLAYGVMLIVCIPTAIIFATIFTVTRYTQTIDVTLQRQALLVGRVFGAAVWEEGLAGDQLQSRVSEVGLANPDVLGLQVFVPNGNEGFTVIASLKPEQVGKVVAAPYYTLAWQQPQHGGLAADYIGAPSVDGKPDPSMMAAKERYWLVSLPLFSRGVNNHPDRIALLSLQLSSKVVDEQADASWRGAIIGLTLTVLLTVLFLAAATRLWSYATLYRKIKEVDRMKDEFISIASHELRTPITALRGYLSMVLSGDFGAVASAVRHGLQRADDSAKRLGDLVEDLLNVSRIEQGRIQLQLQPADLAAAAKEVVEELRSTAVEKKLALNFHPVADPAPSVLVDPDKLKQVLFNVIGNAIKYTFQGSVDVTVMLAEKGDTALVRVKDTGIGIPMEAQQRLFSKFFRVPNEQTKKVSGTGLGLWITKQLVELMHGTIYVESIEGTGTQVTVALPLAKSNGKTAGQG